jgi:membrane fusion protein (multidrug efflux system)
MTQEFGDDKLRRKFLFIIFLGVVFGILLAFWGYFHFVLSKHVTTDNAYVGSEVAQVTSLVSATVETVHFKDTDVVNAGDVLVTLDCTDAKHALAKMQAEYEKAHADYERTLLDCKRRAALSQSGSVSDEEVTTASNLNKISAAVLESVKVSLDQAKLDLERTIVKAPISGRIAKRQVQLGQRVTSGTPLMSIVPLDQFHVNANFKETQILKIKEGQDVTMTTDLYGKSVVFHGKIVGFSGGTGAAFAVIPAQNATGNWIKVVQRLPVRISLDPEELKQHPLQVGLSVNVDVFVGP